MPEIDRLLCSNVVIVIFCEALFSLHVRAFKSGEADQKIKSPPRIFADQYLFWEQALASSDGPFLDGAAPGARDFLLFGVIQCHSSIPVPALIPLQHDERLAGIRGWIAAMHERLHGYAYLYSGGRFEPRKPEPVTADPLQLGVFYLGLTTMFAMFPVTLPLVFLLMRKIKR